MSVFAIRVDTTACLPYRAYDLKMAETSLGKLFNDVHLLAHA
jgi:hypothetical protein